MTHVRFLASALLPLCVLASPGPARADMETLGALAPVTRIDLGAPDSVAPPPGRVVFHNPGSGSARILFPKGDLTAFDCRPDGQQVSRSRAGQFVLQSGAELPCTVEPGSYRYTTLTQQRGAVREARATLKVKH